MTGHLSLPMSPANGNRWQIFVGDGHQMVGIIVSPIFATLGVWGATKNILFPSTTEAPFTLQVETTSEYFTGISNPYIGTMYTF